jgi:leucyl aminopeptidase
LSGDRKRTSTLTEVQVVAAGADGATLQKGVARGEKIAHGIAQARDLANEQASHLTPIQLAAVAQELATKHDLEVEILGPQECTELGMGCFLAVARGSDEEPRLIHLTYRPKGRTPRKRVALIGKSVTFDSGGLSLKTNEGMLEMKYDMGGGGTVISALGVLAGLDCPDEVHVICAATENMPSGKAYKLGDVLRSMAGKTVEINNTDAEGRLTLADAITFTRTRIKPDEIFDFATLTGAAIIALGMHIAPVMGNNPELVQRFLGAATQAGEEMWQLPLPERLLEGLKSEIADLKNTGERAGGAMTAGLFLKEFAGDTPWLHVDMAGPVSTSKESGHLSKGPTGFGVATIVEYLVPHGNAAS